MAAHELNVTIADAIALTAEITASGPQGPVGPTGDPGSIIAGTSPNMEGLTGEYWSPPILRTTGGLISGRLYTLSIFAPFARTIDRIAAEVTASAVGSTITLGIYEDDGAGNAGNLLLDAGTINGNTVAAQEITISQALAGGTRYHLAALCAGGTPTTRTFLNGGWSGRQINLAGATSSATFRHGRTRDGVVGTALPDPAATTALGSGVPLIAVRFA